MVLLQSRAILMEEDYYFTETGFVHTLGATATFLHVMLIEK